MVHRTFVHRGRGPQGAYPRRDSNGSTITIFPLAPPGGAPVSILDHSTPRHRAACALRARAYDVFGCGMLAPERFGVAARGRYR
jgi:hypothetical protein